MSPPPSFVPSHADNPGHSEMMALFPGLADALPPRDGYALRPIGRRRSSRQPTSARSRRPSQAQLLHHLADVLADIGPLLGRIEAELVANTRERRETNEAIGRLARQHTELRRDLGRTELHVLPRHSRRRPLG